jgi:hypothetical protein
MPWQRRPFLSCLLLAVLSISLAGCGPAGSRVNQTGGSHARPGSNPRPDAAETARAASESGLQEYPYGSDRFTQLVAESYDQTGGGNPLSFYDWMETAYSRCRCRYPGKEALGLEAVLNSLKGDLDRIADPGEKASAEVEFSEWVHRLVKTIIPRFSLDRGFEFSSVVKYGERQCFLQSVLIAGLLQRAGMDAGIAMVYRNTRGEETNNGHAVTLVKLTTGEDVIVDASDKEPFARQTGLFVRAPDLLYLNPLYQHGTVRIHSYETPSGHQEIDPSRVRPLDLGFIRSQFWYYRGERARGGLLSSVRSREGLESSVASLLTSVRVCPANPLPVYMLGRAYLAQGNLAQARKEFDRAFDQYSRYGWVPAGLREQLAVATHRTRASWLGPPSGPRGTPAGARVGPDFTYDLCWHIGLGSAEGEWVR